MTAAIAVVYDPVYVRNRVDLTGWSTNGPVTVTGTSADGMSWPVRSITAVSGGVISGYDTEMPFGVPVSYSAYDGATYVQSMSVVRTNLCTTPQPNVTYWQPNSFFGSYPVGTVANSTTHVYGAAAQSVLITWPTSTIGSFVNGPTINVVAGLQYAMSFVVWVPTGSAPVEACSIFVVNGAPSTVFDAWTVVSATFTAASTGTVQVGVFAPTSTAGNTCHLGGCWIEQGGQVLDYFDGATLDTPTLIYGWTGTPNASTSTLSEKQSTINVTKPMLRAPGLPALDVQIEVIATPKVTRPRGGVVLRPLGRRTGIPLAGALSAGEFTLLVRTYTDTQALALEALLSVSPTVLAIFPGTRLSRQYVGTGDLEEDPFLPSIAQTAMPDDMGNWAAWGIPCTVVDRPVGGVFGDPTASYQAGLDSFATYQDSLTAEPTYLDRLKA